MSKPKKKKPIEFVDMWKSIRKDWGGINPSTQIHEDKTKYKRHPKHKKRWNEEDTMQEIFSMGFRTL